jgi:hypothetical protein
VANNNNNNNNNRYWVKVRQSCYYLWYSQPAMKHSTRQKLLQPTNMLTYTNLMAWQSGWRYIKH